jgi:CheY-like chemotaxis protein
MARVLLIDDNKLNADMLTRRLARRGYTVLQARTGREAMTRAQLEPPDLILMELSRPVLDGLENAWPLKTALDTVVIPVIALTAHAMVSDREKALAMGCQEFETKPVNLERLLDKMQALLDGADDANQKTLQPPERAGLAYRVSERVTAALRRERTGSSVRPAGVAPNFSPACGGGLRQV